MGRLAGKRPVLAQCRAEGVPGQATWTIRPPGARVLARAHHPRRQALISAWCEDGGRMGSLVGPSNEGLRGKGGSGEGGAAEMIMIVAAAAALRSIPTADVSHGCRPAHLR
jgi:hypothetical protein